MAFKGASPSRNLDLSQKRERLQAALFCLGFSSNLGWADGIGVGVAANVFVTGAGNHKEPE